IALTSFVRCPRLIETSSPKERIVIDFDINSAKIIPIIPNGIVFGFGSLLQNGLSPVRLAIIGTVIGTFLSSVSAAMASYFQ
ncbi:hypothetical protein P5774_28055, partial [Bacillus tropicus]|nr:hypothetical protein [Bacillus tropicus]